VADKQIRGEAAVDLPSSFCKGLLYLLRINILSSLSFSPPYLGLNRVEVHALKALAAGGAAREPLSVCFAPFLIVEKHPLVLSSNPPELPPDRVLLLARTIECGHRNISLPAHPWAIVVLATNYSMS
jgi:hypothetical protein